MAKGNFDRLVYGLSLDERHILLQKLTAQSSLSTEPLYTDDEPAAADFNTEFAKLPWYSRVWYFFLSLFMAKEPVKVFADTKVSALGVRIEERSPGLFDYQTGLLLPAFYRQIERLREAARFFYPALDMSVNRDRGAFYAFLGSLEMKDVHRRLHNETDPDLIIERKPDADEPEIRQIALKALEEDLTLITEDYRNIMYYDVRSLYCLKDLSSFLFDRVITAFGFSSALKGETCSASVVRELLMHLNDILYSLKVIPPMPLLGSLFVFYLQDRVREPGFNVNRETGALLANAEDALNTIRDFNRRVPLTWIIRCAARNMSYSPKETSGGEDWYMIYHDYWRRHIESLLSGFMNERCRREILSISHSFLGGTSLNNLENVKSDENYDGLPIKGSFALAFLLGFHSVVFMPEINKILKPILIDGEFRDKENRVEFTEAYNNFIKLDDEINKLDREMSPTGDYGQRYIQARQDITSLPVKRRKMQIVVEEAEEDAEKILELTREASQSMINVLNGIMRHDSQLHTLNKYSSLSNLAKIAGKDTDYTHGLNQTIHRFETILKLLDDIAALENSTS